MITISLCMIVKNEEKMLDQCLQCLTGLVDEIIIVDTGSTDRTKNIAHQYTNQIYDFTWVGDFSKARNFAFSKASKEYIYSADADEIVDEANREKFRILKEILLPEIEIVQMYYCNQLKNGSVYNYDKEYRPKLFKRLREFTWIDPVHETVRTEPVVFDSEIEIIHEQQENHAGRDLTAFAGEYKKNGKLSARLLHMYARELFLAGEAEDFKQAEAFFQSVCEGDVSGTEDILSAACILARSARLSGDSSSFFKYAMKAVALEGCAEICMELGNFYREEKDYAEASVWFYNAAFETKSMMDIRCSGDQALWGLAESYREMGMEQAAEEYKRLAEDWKGVYIV